MIIRLLACVFVAGLMLYKYIDKLNELTELQLAIPAVAKEVRELQEKNIELQIDIERFESPTNLIELAKKPELGHLKFPPLTEVLLVAEPARRLGGESHAR